jgi:hypothetical protein
MEAGTLIKLTLTDAPDSASTVSGNTDTTAGAGGASTTTEWFAARDCEFKEFQKEICTKGTENAGNAILTSVEERDVNRTAQSVEGDDPLMENSMTALPEMGTKFPKLTNNVEEVL